MKTIKVMKSATINIIGKILTTLFRSPLFPIFFQILALIIYMGLIWFALGVDIPDGVKPKLYAQNTMTSLVVWGIWLPLLIIFTVFLGRVWCSVCPLEFIQKVGDFMGRKIFGKKLSLPVFLRNSINGVLIYSFLLFMLLATRFPQVPGNAATLLIILAVSSLAVGLFFGNRVFCKYFCPADMLLSALGRRGMLRIRQESSNDNITNITVSKNSCPSYLNLKKLNDASPCTLCGQCVKSDNTVFPVFRAMPSIPDDKWNDYGWGITILAVFLTGFLFEHLFHHWQAGQHYYGFFPNLAKKVIGIKALAGWIEAIWAMIIVPCALWLSMGLIGKLFNISLSIFEIWKKITLPAITALSGLHVILSVEKFSHWITHTLIAFRNLMERVTMSLIPDSIFIVKFPKDGGCHG
ncbi:MAG: 4Fe-4S binding protein, partial [Bacteroidota bacterium]